jgi:formylmethanofuran dehydrogenase subunit E
VTTFVGTQRFTVRTTRRCDRCGRDLVRQTRDRDRADGLLLCRDCTNDRWYIERAAR